MYELFGNEIIDRKDLEMKEKILVFIPMYNCEKQIVRVLDQLNGEIKKYISDDCIDSAIESLRKLNPMNLPLSSFEKRMILSVQKNL